MDNFLESLCYDYEKSFRAFKEVITTDYEIQAYPPRISENHTFGKNFPGGLIKKPHYVKCNFIETKFNSSDGALSQFHDCLFDSCLLENCDFRYCDILKTCFESNISMSKIISCNFSFGNFIDSSFFNTLFLGCSFRQMQVENTQFKNCTMQHCTIEQTKISNCHFENIDLRRVGVRYCTFENTTFESVIFHILDLPRNHGLVELLKNSERPVYVAYKNDQMMNLDDAISYLKLLVPYYLETCQFYELI